MPRALRIGVYKITHKMIKAYDLERELLGHCPIDMGYTDLWSCSHEPETAPCRRWNDKSHCCSARFVHRYIIQPDAERG